jgi:hypothetical protein
MVRTRNYVANDDDQKTQGCQERRPPPVGDATSESWLDKNFLAQYASAVYLQGTSRS